MKATETKAPQEPMGIIISGLPHPQSTTVFSAYIWAPPSTAEAPRPKAG